MRVHLLPIPNLALEKVRYYTVRLENKEVSEFRDFQLKAGQHSREELAEINRYVQQIGDLYGATKEHFKDEDATERLPPPYHRYIGIEATDDYGLRLYCIRVSPGVVILLNGDRKKALKVRYCKNCYKHFDMARKLASKITDAILHSDIEIDNDNKEIIVNEDFDLYI